MSLPEDRKSLKPGNRLISILSFLMLVIFMLLISYLVYLKSNNTDIKNISIKEIFKGNTFFKSGKGTKNDVVQIQYDPKDHPAFGVYKGYIVKCTSDNIKFLDKSGQEVWEKTLMVTNPIIKTNGVELLITGSGSKELYLIRDKEIKWSNKLDNSIVNADISDSGHISVVHETKGYKGAVTVYNLQGGPFFTRNIAEGFVVSAKVSPKARHVVINTLETGGIRSSSGITITDMLGNPLAEKVVVDDTIFPAVWYLDNETIAAVSSSKVFCWGKDGKLKWEKLFEEKDIYSSAVLGGKNIILAISGEDKGGLLTGSSTDVFSINQEGKETKIYSINEVVKNIDIRDDIIAVNTGKEVHFINYKGKLVYKYSSKMGISEVKFLNKDEAVIVTKNSIEVLNID